MADEETTRDALTAAYDKHTPETVVEETVADTPATQAAPESAPEASEALSTSQDAASPPDASASTQTLTPQAAAPSAVVAPAGPPAKPPRSWSPEAKAEFANLKPAVQADILKREREISQGLEKTAPARQHYEKFSEVVKPFEPLMQAYGVEPLDAMKVLLSTRAGLEIGTPEQKAAIVANICHDFGIDVTLLDNLLVQRGPVQPFRPAAPPPRAPLDPRLEELINTVQQAKVAKAEAEIAKVEALPHFEELREDMADIVERFHANGKPISVEAAYKRALAMNPDLEPTQAAPTISKSQAAAILASRNAASSVSGAPRTGATPAPNDRRSQIAAAFESARTR